MQAPATPEYVSLQDLSLYSGLCIKTLRTFLNHPECPLPHYCLPRKILVRKDEYDAWLAMFRVKNPNVDIEKFVSEVMNTL